MLLAFALALAALFGCATDTGNPTRDRFGRVANATVEEVGTAALKIASSALLKQAQTGFSSDWGWSLQQGLFENLPSIVSAETFAKIAKAWNPAAPEVNHQLVALVPADATKEEVHAAVNAIAHGIVSATTQYTTTIAK